MGGFPGVPSFDPGSGVLAGITLGLQQAPLPVLGWRKLSGSNAQREEFLKCLLPSPSQDMVKRGHFLHHLPWLDTALAAAACRSCSRNGPAALPTGQVKLSVMADFVLTSQKIQDNCQVRAIAVSHYRDRPVWEHQEWGQGSLCSPAFL